MSQFKEVLLYMKRLLPFTLVIFVASIIGLVVPIVYSFSDIYNLSGFFYFLPIYLGTTLFVAGCFKLPMIVFLTLLPSKFHNGRLDKIITYSAFTGLVGLMIFCEVSECFFWDEFTCRFNFVAVDYLVYTQEVVANIMQSYPMVPIFIGLAIVSVFCCYKFKNKLIVPSLVVPRFKWRLAACIFFVVLLIIVGLPNYAGIAEKIGSRYLSEISKNGVYCFFRAFRTNELSYRDFYPVIPVAELEKIRKTLDFDGNYDKDEIRPDEKRPNIIIVLMESMGSKYFHEFRDDDVRITQRLEAIASESLYFSRTYAVGTRTVRGLEAATLGVPPLPGASICRRDGNDNLNTLGSVLRRRGYSTKWIYAGYGTFDSMNDYFEGNGFTTVDRMSFDRDEITFSTAWGVCDENLFDKVIKICDEDYKSGKPFFNFVLTTSNHRPFTYPEGRIDIPSKTSRFGGVKYADYCAGKFLDDAKKKPWYENTIIVYLADHSAGSQGDKELNFSLHQIPMIIHGPKYVAPRKIEYPVSQIDFIPTLLSLINIKPVGFIGKNALAEDYISRWFACNYQKIAYVKGNESVILSPVRHVNLYRNDKLVASLVANKEDGSIKAPDAAFEKLYKEAVTYIQFTDNWRTFLKEKNAK